MRILHAVLGLFFAGLVAAACTINQDNCDKNPECKDYPGNKHIGTDMTGGGGTGGSMCTVPTDCPVSADQCKERTCEGGTCGTKDKDCGTLTCDPVSGQCAGCNDNDPQKKCPPKDCHDIVCEQGMCKETPNGKLTCDGGNGTCDDAGNCGKCNDDVKNGDETGVDCGAGTPCGECSGAPCVSAVECKSGFCADGVCCDTPCDGLCQACNQPGKAGVCSPLPLETEDDIGNGQACGLTEGGCGETLGYCRCNDGVKNGDETDVDCGGSTCGKQCGTGHLCSKPTDCVGNPPHCVDGYCCGAPCTNDCKACNLPELEGLCTSVDPGTKDVCGGTQVCGASVCAEPSGGCSDPSDCASNNCSAQGQCAPVCAQDIDCPTGQVCMKGACFEKGTQGKSCLSTNACQDGLTCVDGVCCDTPCDGLCMACHLNYTAQPSGTCAPIQEGYDPHNECPQLDPSQPGPGGSAYCSGADAVNGNSSCAQPQP